MVKEARDTLLSNETQVIIMKRFALTNLEAFNVIKLLENIMFNHNLGRA